MSLKRVVHKTFKRLFSPRTDRAKDVEHHAYSLSNPYCGPKHIRKKRRSIRSVFSPRDTQGQLDELRRLLKRTQSTGLGVFTEDILA